MRGINLSISNDGETFKKVDYSNIELGKIKPTKLNRCEEQGIEALLERLKHNKSWQILINTTIQNYLHNQNRSLFNG